MTEDSTKMKLLIVGSDKVYAIENFYVKYLREQGIDVLHFSAQSYFYDYYQKSIINKLIAKVGLSGVYRRINKRFKAQVTTFKPDVVWIFKGMEIWPQSLKWVRAQNIKLINYNGDHPFIFSGKGSGNKNVSDGIPLFDLHLTYNAAVKKQMEATWHIPTAILPFGFNMNDALFASCQQQSEILKVCFLGNPDEFRGKFLQELAAKGISIDVYGNDWKKFVQHPCIQIFQPVYGDEFWYTLRKYRIQLNLMRPHNPDTHNMRSFELAGVGGIQLAPDTPDHRNYFEVGTEIFVYKDLDECMVEIKKILAMPKQEADNIRRNARSRSITGGYTYRDRSAQALQQIEKLLG